MKSTPGVSLFVGAVATVLLTIAGFFLYPAMISFVYPNVGTESLEQYFLSQIITALSFTLLGCAILLYGWIYSKRYRAAVLKEIFLAPFLIAFGTIIIGLFYYKHGLHEINLGNDIGGYPMLMMASDIKVHYIPIAASFLVLLLLVNKIRKGKSS